MIGVGVVGYGYAGRVFHCPLITQIEGLRLVAVSSRDAQRREQARQQWNVRTYAQPEELLSDEQVQLVVIATPHHTHHALGKMALQAGKHVVIDKPFTITTAEADDLIHEAWKRNLLLSVFHNRRWDWDYLTVRKVMEEGLLGEIWQVESCVGRYGHSSRWRSQRESMGSLLHDWGAHLIDQAIQLMGLPTQVMAWRHFRMWQSDVESFIRAVLDYGDGRTFTVEVNYLRAAERPRWYVLGDRGGLRLESLARATGECGIPPFWREPLGRFDLVGICSTLVALPVFRAEALPGEWPEWERRRAEHLAQVREVFAGLEAGRRLVLFCHDPTALPFLWAEPVVRERAQQIALTIVGHLHTPLVFGLAQRLAGVPPVNFLGVAVRRITGALNRAQCWRPFRVALCPSLAGCQLLKDGGFLTLDLDDAAGGRWRLRRHRLPW